VVLVEVTPHGAVVALDGHGADPAPEDGGLGLEGLELLQIFVLGKVATPDVITKVVAVKVKLAAHPTLVFAAGKPDIEINKNKI
jgi:hypothetical protein